MNAVTLALAPIAGAVSGAGRTAAQAGGTALTGTLALLTWALRKAQRGPGAYTYSARCMVTGAVAAAAVLIAADAAVVQLLVPWPWLRWTLIGTGGYLVLLGLGLYVSVAVRPHVIAGSGVRIGYGLFAETFIPYTHIVSVEAKRRKAPAQKDGLSVSEPDRAAWLSVGGQTDVVLWLWKPVTLRRTLSVTPPVHTIYAAVDDPAGFTRAVTSRLPRATGQAVAGL
jgi:hypothetical protein